jgi:hypothetical protein
VLFGFAHPPRLGFALGCQCNWLRRGRRGGGNRGSFCGRGRN